MANLPHVVQYQGSKRILARHILRFFPQKVSRLVEPFAGTAAVSIAAVTNQISHRFWLNDLNKPLIELLELAIEEPTKLSDAYADIWNQQISDSVGHYYSVREEFNETQDPGLFLYILARCVKGSVRYNLEGMFNQSPDKRRKGTKPETMRKNIEGVSSLLKNKCHFTSLDYRQVLNQVKRTDFVYMDPPYQGVCGNRDSRYLSGIDFDKFVLTLEKLNYRKIEFAISYDGKLGSKTFGQPLPSHLKLKKIEIEVGRSSQATLLGRKEKTVESFYVSSGIAELWTQKRRSEFHYTVHKPEQLTFLEKNERYSTSAR